MTELTIDQALKQGVEAHKAGQAQEADRLYTTILKAQPKHPDANHNMGVLAVGVGKVKQALPFFKTALEANPATVQFWLSYIDALIKLGQLADAKAVLDQARSKGAKGDGFDKLETRLNETGEEPVVASKVAAEPQPKQPNILDSLKLDQAIKLAKKKAKEGDPEEARHIYRGILTKFPKNKRASEGLKGLAGKIIGKAYKVQDPPRDQLQALFNLYSQGQLQQALKQAENLVQKFPMSAILFNIQAAVLKGLGQLELSVDAYNKALAIKPDYAEAYNNMGNALQEQGKLEGAIEAYNKALAINADYADAHYNMGVTLKEQGKLEEAIEAYNKALAIKPDYAEAYNNMGIAFKDQGKLEEAKEAYNKALAIKPDNAEAYNNMGIALQEQGKLEEAIEAYNKALALKPDYAEAFNNIGNARKKQGKLEGAIEAYNKALAINADYADAHYNMGNALQDQVKLAEAIEAYNKALEIKPDFAEAYYNMGNALQDQSKLDEATEAFNRAITIKPDYSDAYSNMGNALQKQGKPEEAIEAYDKALAIKPYNAECFINFNSLKIQLSEPDFRVLNINNDANNILDVVLSRNPKYQIQQAISNFILGKLPSSGEYLQKYRTLMETKAFQVLLQKDQMFCVGYYKFLGSLIKNNIPIHHINNAKIYHIGESHCLSYAHSSVRIETKPHVVVPKIAFGAKAFHFSNKSENLYKAITANHLKKIPNGSVVFVSVGEIDCRADEGIIQESDKTGKILNEIINETVDGYIEFFLNQNIKNQHTYYFFNVPAPMHEAQYSEEVNNKVAEVVGLFNADLLKKASSSKTKTIDVYRHTVDGRGFSNGLYHCDNRHLDNRIIPLIENGFNA